MLRSRKLFKWYYVVAIFIFCAKNFFYKAIMVITDFVADKCPINFEFLDLSVEECTNL